MVEAEDNGDDNGGGDGDDDCNVPSPLSLQIFEEFLQKLLQKPALKGSQLLFLFLKTKDEFTNTYLPDVSLGRLIRDVPRKLMKERGQHLDAFINVFLSSTVTTTNASLARSKSK